MVFCNRHFTGKRQAENQSGTPLFQTAEGRYLAASNCRFPFKLAFENTDMH